MAHICVGNLSIIGLNNGLSPGRRQAIIWTNMGILSIGPLGTIFSEIIIEILAISFKNMHMKMSSVKSQSFCLVLNELGFVAPISSHKIYLIQRYIQIYGVKSLCVWYPFWIIIQWSFAEYRGIGVLNWHDDAVKWKHFPRYWPFVRGFHWSPVIPFTKASDTEL